MADINELARTLQRINSGEISAEEAEGILAGISELDLSLAEQRLLEEGISENELRRLCEVHLRALENKTQNLKEAAGPGHPLHTLISEHELILGFLDALESATSKLETKGSFSPEDEDLAIVEDVAHHLVETEKHHQREEEALFPAIEERGLTGPPRIMRLEHTELRPKKRQLLELARKAGDRPYDSFINELRELTSSIVFNLREHIFKENMILYPAAFEVIKDEPTWKAIKEKSDAIGYCCFTPGVRTVEVIKVEELPVVRSPRGPKIRKVMSRPDVAVTNVILGPGETLPSHLTPVDVFFYVRSGSGKVVIEDEEVSVSEGDIVVSPKNIPHGLKGGNKGEFSVLVVKTPNPDRDRTCSG